MKTLNFKTHQKNGCYVVKGKLSTKRKTKRSHVKGLLWAGPFSNDLHGGPCRAGVVSFHPGGKGVPGRTLMRAMG